MSSEYNNNKSNQGGFSRIIELINDIPLFVRFVLITNVILIISNIFTPYISFYLSNIPVLIIKKYQLWRLITTSFITTNLINMILGFIVWTKDAISLEKSLGTIRYIVIFIFNSIFINLISCLLTYLFRKNIFDITQYSYIHKVNNSGIWPIIICEMTLLCFNNPDIMNKYYIFMEPLIPRYSFYRSFLLGSNKTSYYSYEAQVFNKFIFDNLDFYVNYENDKIKILNNLLSEYFKNKKIYCSPNGLMISDNKDFKNRYNFKYLSEGEKKVILLLIISVFNDNDVLILDEVETSLSVIWQKRLINDLLKEGNIDHLIVSTQSPFIVDDDTLFENVVCLPGDVNYE